MEEILTPSFTCNSAKRPRSPKSKSFLDPRDLNFRKYNLEEAIGVGDAFRVMNWLLCLCSPFFVFLEDDGNLF
jgi:hypothetical protein